MKCLLVAPSFTLRRILTHALDGRDDLEITTAPDAAAALQQAASGVDLVLAEWHLPGERSGLELATALRELPAAAATKIVLVTNRNRREDVERAVASGVNGYVVRPFSAAGLRARLLHHLPAPD